MQRLVEANRELIERMEKKIQATIDRIWVEGFANAPERIELTHASNVV